MPNAFDKMRTSAFIQYLGAEFISSTDGPPTMRLTVREELLQVMGVTHGGVIGALVDTAIGAAVAHAVGGREPNIVTVEFKVNLLAPSRLGDVLTTTAELLHHGRQTFVGLARVTNQKGQLIASGTATYLRLLGG